MLTFCANGTTVFPILFFNPLILSSTQLRLFYKISIQFFHTNIISPYHVNNNAEVLKVSLLHFPSTSVRFDNCKKYNFPLTISGRRGGSSNKQWPTMHFSQSSTRQCQTGKAEQEKLNEREREREEKGGKEEESRGIGKSAAGNRLEPQKFP